MFSRWSPRKAAVVPKGAAGKAGSAHDDAPRTRVRLLDTFTSGVRAKALQQRWRVGAPLILALCLGATSVVLFAMSEVLSIRWFVRRSPAAAQSVRRATRAPRARTHTHSRPRAPLLRHVARALDRSPCR